PRPVAGEGALGGAVGDGESTAAAVAGGGVLVLIGAVTALRHGQPPPAQRGVGGHVLDSLSALTKNPSPGPSPKRGGVLTRDGEFSVGSFMTQIGLPSPL